MAQFKNKKQRKKVMKLVKQHDQNLRFAHRTIQSKKGTMSANEIHDYIDKHQPYPNHLQQSKDGSKNMTEQEHDLFMK